MKGEKIKLLRLVKTKKISLLFFILSSFIFAKNFNISEKTLKNGIVYRKGEEEAFTGVFKGEGIHEEYRKGVKNGKFIGEVTIDKEVYVYEGIYVEGVKNGEWKIRYPDGKIKAILNYNYDLPKGQWTYFYDNNQIQGYENFNNGVISGETIFYTKDGNLLKRSTYKNGLIDGEMVLYRKNHSLDSIVNFSVGKLDGKIEVYSQNNILQLQGNYKNNKRENLWKLYYNTGDLKMIISYNHGLKNGRMVVYGKAGEIVQTTIYKDNHEVDSSGNIITKASSEGEDNIATRYSKLVYNFEYLKYNNALSSLR